MIIHGQGAVWNPNTGSIAFHFGKDGTFETDNRDFLKLAKLNGLLVEGEEDLPEEVRRVVVVRKKKE